MWPADAELARTDDSIDRLVPRPWSVAYPKAGPVRVYNWPSLICRCRGRVSRTTTNLNNVSTRKQRLRLRLA